MRFGRSFVVAVHSPTPNSPEDRLSELDGCIGRQNCSLTIR
jgi:hypothetical protein